MSNNDGESGYGQMAEGAEHFHTGMEVAELGAEAGVLGETAAATGGVALAGYAGYEIGTGIENETHIGSAAGDYAYNHSNQDDAHAAAVSADDASQSWHDGHPLDAAEHAAETIGHMASGLWHGHSDN